MLQNVVRIDHRDDRIEAEPRPHFIVGEERLRDGRGVGEAGGLDENAVELVLALEQAGEDADEVAAHAAADAAVVHLEEFFLALDDELVVDADLAEFVFDHGEFFAVVFGEDTVEERGFAGAEEAGEDGDGNHAGDETGQG
jgi:hypothetical protein